MAKKKILIITFSCICVVILAVLGLVLGLNWNKIASWFNGAQVYTYEEIQAATEDAYNKGLKEREALIKQVEDYKSQVDKLLTKVDSVNNEFTDYKNSVNDLLDEERQKGFKNGYNEGYSNGLAEGILYGTNNVPDNSCVVVFNSNIPQGSTSEIIGDMPLTILNSDNNLLPQNTFNLKGYSFTGWNTAADGSGDTYVDLSPLNPSLFDGRNVLGLFAQWSVVSYNCEFLVNSTSYNGLINISSPVEFSITVNYDEIFKMPDFNLETLSINHSCSDFDLNLKVNSFKWVNVATGIEFSINEFVRNLSEGETVKFVANYDLAGEYLVKKEIVLFENGQNVSMTMASGVLFYNLSSLPENASRIAKINCLITSSERYATFNLESANEFVYTDNLDIKYYLDSYNCFRVIQVGAPIGAGPTNLYNENATLTIECVTYDILIKGDKT